MAWKPDVRIIGHASSLLLFMLLTPRAKAWVEEHVQDDAPYFGPSLVVEPRYAEGLLNGLREAGLTVA